MGKEHDLLNASKTGNVSQIEKILGQRGKKSGLQSIIVRSTNPNYQDEMGYTPLHYGSLNGHRAAVELLLKYDASANIPDHSGNYPLHLAAFNGHADVCRVLINSGPSRAKVNEQNGTEDTAMHSAAQSKSSQVVAVLLENHADPFIRNCRKESPLDLAAQYGRIENVKLLLSYHPNLLQNNVKTHSPLHLAARNGHIDVVSNLLGCGMAVNFQCDTGTALHEAALFGKLDVCNFLLQCDVDIAVKDKNQMTVMDLLMNHPTARTKEISALIYNYTQTTKTRSKSVKGTSQSNIPVANQRASTISYTSSSYDFVPDPGRRDTYDTVPAFHQQQQHQPSNYDCVPPLQPSTETDGMGQDSMDEPSREISGYHFVTAPGSESTSMLTPQQVTEGYTMLGVPNAGRSKNNNGGEYCTVRPQGSQVAGSPTSNSMDQQQRSLSGGRTDPLPSRDMVSKDNLAYYQIEPHTSYQQSSPTHTSTTPSGNVPEYEYVPHHPPQRPLNIPEYEVPPAPISQATQPEGDYGLVGAINSKPSKPVRQMKRDAPDMTPSSPSVYEVPPSFKQREEETEEGSPRGQVCPLDVSQNDLERLGYNTTTGNLGPDAAALATQAGYEFMDRQSPVDNRYEYEVLAPSRFEPKQPPVVPGQYEVVSFPARPISEGPPRAPLAQSPPVYEIAPRPILAPQEPCPAATNVSQSPPVYEIAPPPRPQRPAPYSVPASRPQLGNVPQSRVPPDGGYQPDNVPTVPARPQADYNVPPAARLPQQNVPLIEGMDDKEHPLPAPRPGNEYQQHRPVQPLGEPAKAANPQGMPPPYEKVRIEGPKGGKLSLEQAPTPVLPPRTHLGDYCTIDPNAISPMDPPSKRDQASSGSSFGSMSEGSDVSDVPLGPPPSASVAEAVVFETLERDEAGKPAPHPRHKETPTSAKKPTPLPRRESLNDRPKWHTDDVKQDPFSNPPNKEQKVSNNDDENDSSSNTVFSSLHKQFSPHSSREDLTDISTENKDVNESEPSTPLIYENVLFLRSDSTSRNSVSKKPQPQASQVEADTTVNDDSGKTKNEMFLSSTSLDEDAEWEEIDQLLLSLQGIENLGEQMADAGNATTVSQWLKALGVGQYETDLMSNGFDDLDFLNGGVLEDQDLMDIGVTDLSHRKIILEAVKSLPAPPRIAKLENPPNTVEEWLTLIKLGDYLDVFLHQGFPTMERVKQLWEVELTSVLEINCLGHRNRILASLIEPRRMTMVRKSRQTEMDSKGNFGLDEKLAELKAICPDEDPAKVVSSLDNEVLDTIAEKMINDEGLRRKTLQRKKQNRWRHDPEVLLKGSVNYTTQYLGSQTVKEIVGIKSTVEACRKMKLSTAKLQKIPSVTLAVSVSGIKFIDSRTKLVVSNHQMNNVSYITQDPDNRQVFAYIAKDAKVNRHYCHVFRVEDVTVSDEITMTIGQAFELAYDQYVQIQKLITSQQR